MPDILFLTVKRDDEVEEWRQVVKSIFGEENAHTVQVSAATDEELKLDIPEGRRFPELRTPTLLFGGELHVTKAMLKIAVSRTN